MVEFRPESHPFAGSGLLGLGFLCVISPSEHLGWFRGWMSGLPAGCVGAIISEFDFKFWGSRYPDDRKAPILLIQIVALQCLAIPEIGHLLGGRCALVE